MPDDTTTTTTTTILLPTTAAAPAPAPAAPAPDPVLTVVDDPPVPEGGGASMRVTTSRVVHAFMDALALALELGKGKIPDIDPDKFGAPDTIWFAIKGRTGRINVTLHEGILTAGVSDSEHHNASAMPTIGLFKGED